MTISNPSSGRDESTAAYLRDWRSWGVWVYLWPLGILAYFIDRRLAK